MLASVHTSNEQREKRTLGGIEWWRIQKTMFRKRQTPFSLVSKKLHPTTQQRITLKTIIEGELTQV